MAREIRFRDALREAMQEEMRRDEMVFLMGEEVAEYNGAYKVSQGMLLCACRLILTIFPHVSKVVILETKRPQE